MAEGVQSALAAAENLELSLDELDDKEFELPQVDNPPTLESILNEPDDETAVDDPPAPQYLQGDASDTASMSSQEGILGDGRRKRVRKNIHYEKHGSIMRHVLLKGVSAQMVSAADRVDAGMPTALAVSSMIAIGTSHGLVLVFDPKQVLKWALGSTAVGAQYGAVSAISFNRDCTRLLAGFAKGEITMWDLTNGKLLRTITDAHPPGTAILHVKFTDDPTLAVCSDSGGSVFELEMKRLIGVRTCESRCLFSGSRGEVCTVEPLHMNHTVPDHPMRDVILLAMASLSKPREKESHLGPAISIISSQQEDACEQLQQFFYINYKTNQVFIVTLRPQLKVLFTHPLKGDPATLPLLAWQFVIIQVSERDRVVDPVLSFARDSSITFFQVVCHSADDIRFAMLQKTEVPYKLLALTWMNSRTMIAVDVAERIHILDVRSEEQLEVIDLVEVQLVYSTSFYKSLATGGNVSKALAYAGERACYQSMVCFNGQLVFLGTRSVHVMTMRSWLERVDVLVRQHKCKEALQLAQSFYEGTAKAVVGLTGVPAKRRGLVANKMLELLDFYVELAVSTPPPENLRGEEVTQYYQDIIPVCVEHCLILDRTDILFERIYERFSYDPVARGTFLECLEPYILSDRLTGITPSVMKDFVDHYADNTMLQQVEACIVHLDIASLDIHQVVNLCWAQGLYDAILYIYNKGMADYARPLEELLGVLAAAVSTGKQLSDLQIKLGNKLLVYISCCLAGRAYPLGDIPVELVSKVKHEVFMALTCLHTQSPHNDEPVYPHLRTLLQFDTREFFNVLALAFEEREFNTQEGVEKRQRLVDILLQIMVESVGFTPTQVGILFTFLARQMARHEATIQVNRMLFEQVLEFLARPDDASRHEERQQALLELLQAGGLEQFDEARLLALAENAQFFRVCELLYEKRGEYDKIISCYWRDPARQHQAFSYIKHVLVRPGFSVAERGAVVRETLTHIRDLISIDSRKTASLVLKAFPASLREIVDSLHDSKDVLYDFLQGVFEAKDAAGLPTFPEKQVTVDPEVHELYIDLMCEKRPAGVYAYVHSAEGYRLSETLAICRKHAVMYAVGHLLEKSGDIQGAFNILLESLVSKLGRLTALLEETAGEETPTEGLQEARDDVQTTLAMVVQLCQRNSPHLNETEREALWFPLLETMMRPQQRLKDSVDKKRLDEFKELTSHVLNSMMGYIALPAILQKIMQDPSYSTGKFGEIRELILGMLETYTYEKTLLNTCTSLVQHDLHTQLSGLTATVQRGIVPRGSSCNLCNKALQPPNDTEASICFRCGHSYHLPCLRVTGSGGPGAGSDTDVWACYLCSSARPARPAPTVHRVQRLAPSSASRPLPLVASRHQPAAPRHQPPAATASYTPAGDGKHQPVLLDSAQIQALDNLRRVQKTPSRLALLAELAKPEGQRSKFKTSQPSIFQNEYFQLRLAPPIKEL